MTQPTARSGRSGSFHTNTFSDTTADRLDRFGRQVGVCLDELALVINVLAAGPGAADRDVLNRRFESLRVAVESARELFDATPVVRAAYGLDDPAVVIGPVVAESACDAALELSEWVLAAAVVDAGGAGRLIAALSVPDLRALKVRASREVAKGLMSLGKPAAGPRVDAVAGLDSAQPFSDPERGNMFRRECGVWRIRYGGDEKVVKDMAGMSYIHVLLSAPDRPIPALTLVNRRVASSASSRTLCDARELTVRPAAACPHAVLDDQAFSEYRSRIDEIESELSVAERNNDAGRHLTLKEEREAILQEIHRAIGLGGRVRPLNTLPEERARQSVQKRIAAAYRLLESNGMGDLAHHLRASIDTGASCVYKPARGTPPWVV